MLPTPGTVKWSAYLCFAQAALLLLVELLAVPALFQLLGGEPRGVRGRGGNILLLVGFLALCVWPVFLFLYAFLGFGLLKRWSWVRWATIVVSIIEAVLAFPVGTVVGGIIIYLLTRPDAVQAFARSPVAPPGMPPANRY